MAIYTTLKAKQANKHGIFRSSRLKSTSCGKIWDVIVRDVDDAEIAVDDGVAVKVGLPTYDGLQTRYGTVATTKDRVAIVGNPALVKHACTKFMAQEWNFFLEPGEVAKCYEVLADEAEVFGVAAYQFTTVLDTVSGIPAEGNLVVVDGNGGWTELVSTASVATYGFAGRVYGYEQGDFETIVLIECIKNEDIA